VDIFGAFLPNARRNLKITKISADESGAYARFRGRSMADYNGGGVRPIRATPLHGGKAFAVNERITTAIDYINGILHPGHFHEKVLADVIARFHSLAGNKVFFSPELTNTTRKSSNPLAPWHPAAIRGREPYD